MDEKALNYLAILAKAHFNLKINWKELVHHESASTGEAPSATSGFFQLSEQTSRANQDEQRLTV